MYMYICICICIYIYHICALRLESAYLHDRMGMEVFV